MITRYMKKVKAHTIITYSRQHDIFSVVTHLYQVKGGTKRRNKQNVDVRN